MAQKVLDFAHRCDSFSKKMLLEAFAHEAEIKSGTLGWVLCHLVLQNKLTRIKRGLYALQTKAVYAPEPTPAMKKIADFMRQEFPFAPYCLYAAEYFGGLQQHLSLNRLLYLEVPRDMMETVAEALQAEHLSAFANPGKDALAHYIDSSKEGIIVIPLMSQAPIQKLQSIPTPRIEKLLVDLYTMPVFNHLQGVEYGYIFRNAYEQFAIQEDTLLRYASRRFATDAIKKYLLQNKAL